MRLLPDGAVLASRALAKVRKLERGHAHVEALLERHGAPPRGQLEPRAWLERVLPLVTRKLRHPGNHKYVWALNRRVRRTLAPSLPYPKVTVVQASLPWAA